MPSSGAAELGLLLLSLGVILGLPWLLHLRPAQTSSAADLELVDPPAAEAELLPEALSGEPVRSDGSSPSPSPPDINPASVPANPTAGTAAKKVSLKSNSPELSPPKSVEPPIFDAPALFSQLPPELPASLQTLPPAESAPSEAGASGVDQVAAAYDERVRAIVLASWRRPVPAKSGAEIPDLSTRIRVTIRRDGRIDSYRILTPSGNLVMDRTVLDTVGAIMEFPPLPDSIIGDSYHSVVTLRLADKAP